VHIFIKSRSIYVKRSYWSAAHSTHIVEYILSPEMLRVCDIFL